MSINHIKFLLYHLFDLPKTIWFNYKLFPLATACKLPILIGRKCRVKSLPRGSVVLDFSEPIRPFMIKIGIEGLEGVANERHGHIQLGPDARAVFHGRALLTSGISLRSAKGEISFGNNFYSNRNLTVICSERIHFGDNCLLGWDVSVRDCDGHTVKTRESGSNSCKPVEIGANTWIGARVDILKGASVGNGCVVAYRSCLTRPCEEDRVLIAGYPAKVIRKDIEWSI